MASSVLTGVNPVHGLYASIFGPVGGGLTQSTKLMVITTTSASALAAGSAISAVPEESRPNALFMLTIVAGVIMVIAGRARLGRFTRFVPHSVMIGFLTGVAANIVFGQLPDFFGAEAEGPFALAKAWDLITHPARIDVGTTVAGASALVLLVVLSRTKLSSFAAVIALIIPTAMVGIWGSSGIVRVSDVGEIPRGLPLPVIPDLSLFSLSILAGGFAVAALVLVQGAGVSEAAPNPDRSRSDPNQDFVAQGVGNIASGFFQGQPVGGSVGQTALNVSAGARGRWASIFSGLWMAVILLVFSGLVGLIVMASLAAVLIYAAIGSIRLSDIRAILRTGSISRVAVVATFVATLVLPVAAAVGVGLTISLLLQLNREALDLRLVRQVPGPGGHFSETPPPHSLETREAILLDVYGSLFYAGARTLQARLPDPGRSRSPAVVLRLRGRAILGATAFEVLSDYAERLADVGGRLYLSGIDAGLRAQMRNNRLLETAENVVIFEAVDVVGEASLAAFHEAEAWLEAQVTENDQ
jgi:SulP family sulfate permease